MKMRVLAAGLTLLLASAGWAASIAASEAAANESAPAPAQAPGQAPQAAAAVSASAAHPLAAYLALRPALAPKPAFFPPLVDSKAFVDRKAALLSSLFGLPPPPPPPPPPAAPAPGPVFPWFAPGFFAAKKNSFLAALMAAQAGAPYAAQPPYAAQQPPYAAQQPAPPSRRAIFGVVPAGGAAPGLAVGPSVFAAKKAAFLQRLFEALNATEAPPTPAPAPLPSWLDLLDDAPQPDNSADAAAAPQALGRVPLAAASAPADPSAARAQFLSALSGGLGLPKPTIVPPAFWSPFALAKPTIVPPGFWVPAGKPSPAALYRAKVASFLGALLQQANASAAAPPPAASRRSARAVEGAPEAAEGGSAVERRGALGAPFGGPFAGPFGGAFGPFGAGKPFGPAVDPQFFMDKKTAFLSQLFASKAASTADASGGDANPAPAPAFGPFAPYAFAPTPKPTIVPPDFWSPFAALKAPSPAAAAFADKKAKFLSTLLALKATTTPAPPPQEEEDPAEDDEEADFDAFLQELAERLSAPGAGALARRSLPPGSPDAARQQLIDAALAQMAALKDDIVATANAILLKQKEAQQPAFPFAKGPYAAYGASKKGGPPPGVASKKGGPPPGVFSKKGGPPPGVFSKKGGPPGGGFPLWGGAAPTPDPTAALQQRLQVLSQAFDSLAALERDASAALQAPSAPATPAPAPAPAPSADAAALLQLLRQAAASPKGARKGKGARGPAARSLQFAVRQGQFSLPPGAEELLTAGGGATPGQQEGGGLRLQAGEQDGAYAWDEAADAAPAQDWPRRHHSHHTHH